jgi:hypothetical protein
MEYVIKHFKGTRLIHNRLGKLGRLAEKITIVSNKQFRFNYSCTATHTHVIKTGHIGFKPILGGIKE